MHTTVEAIIEPNGRVHILEQLNLVNTARALVTILEDVPHPVEITRFPTQAIGTDFSELLASLTEFPSDFMADDREQPTMQERENLF